MNMLQNLVYCFIISFFYCEADIKYYEPHFAKIVCNYNEMLFDLKPSNDKISVSKITIDDCPNPDNNTTYRNVLERLNIDARKAEELKIVIKEQRAFFNWQFEDLVSGTKVEIKRIAKYGSTDLAFIYQFEAKGGRTSISNGRSIVLDCNGNSLKKLPNTFMPSLQLNPHILEINDCASFKVPIAEVLNHANIKLNVTLVYFRHFADVHTRLTYDLLKSIRINGLYIETFDYGVTVDVEVFKENVLTLKEINFDGVIMPAPPKGNIIEKVELSYTAIYARRFDYCNKLKSLKMFSFEEIIDLSMCVNIEDMSLVYLSKETVKVLLNGKPELHRLEIESCDLDTIFATDFLQNATKLEYLRLSQNRVSNTDKETLPLPWKLKTLSLTFSEVNASLLFAAINNSAELRTLILDNNRQLDFCENSTYAVLPSLTELSLDFTNLSKLCFGSFTNLQRLKATGSKVSQLNIKEVPSSNTHEILIDLRTNPLSFPQREKEICMDFNYNTTQLHEAKKVTILTWWRMRCDCEGGCLWSELQQRPWLQIEGATCPDDRPFQNQDTGHIQRLQCTKNPLDCSPCACREYWHDGSISVDCHARGLSQLPLNLVTLLDTQLHTNITYIDLRDNGVLSANKEASEALFSEPARKIHMAGTSPVCSCDNNRLLLQELQSHNHATLDFDNLTTICFGEKMLLKELDIDQLCGIEYWVFVTPISLLAIIILGIYFMYTKYNRQINVFLFAHGCCVSCLQEEDIFTDKEFDAFISFCHEDDEFIHENIIPQLSEYKLCIHYRDWLAGDWIPAQIARSIDLSLRTIVVMSKNFLNSKWGLMEFRMAHASTAEKGRAKIIVVLLDDVFELAELDAELRSYLAMNTYIKWGDPWFFQKLKLTLPRRKSGEDTAEMADDLRMAAITYRRDAGLADDVEDNTFNVHGNN